MIRKLSIKSFKSLLDVEIELGRINVFVGANGSGKSNLLEALGVLGAAASGRVDSGALSSRGVRLGLPVIYKSSFRGTTTRTSIGFEASSEDAAFAVELLNPLKEPAPAWAFKNEALSESGKRVQGRSPASVQRLRPDLGWIARWAVELAPERPAARLLEELAAYCIYAPDTRTLRSLVPDIHTGNPVGLAGGRLPEAVRELLHFAPDQLQELLALIGWADAVEVRKAGAEVPLSPWVPRAGEILLFRDRYMGDRRNSLTGYDASEGALYVLFAAALALLPDAPPVFAIDNVDQGLNPRLARAFIQQLCGWVLDAADRQVLMTTHNPLVLDGLPLDDDEVRLFAVGRSRKGRTTVTRIKVDLNQLQRDGELWTVSRLWVMGHLGGMPDV